MKNPKNSKTGTNSSLKIFTRRKTNHAANTVQREILRRCLRIQVRVLVLRDNPWKGWKLNGRIVLEQRENHLPNVVRLFLIFAPFFSKCRALDEKRRVRTSTRMSTNPCARKGGLGYTRTRSAWFRRSQEKRSRAGFFHFFPVVFVSL